MSVQVNVTCPHCGGTITVEPARLLGSMTSEKKAAAARANAKRPRGPRKPKPE